MNTILLHSNQTHVSATDVAILIVVGSKTHIVNLQNLVVFNLCGLISLR
jgi:hypothetical protein